MENFVLHPEKKQHAANRGESRFRRAFYLPLSPNFLTGGSHLCSPCLPLNFLLLTPPMYCPFLCPHFKPHRFSLRAAIQSFVDFRFATVRRRTAFELGKVYLKTAFVGGPEKCLNDFATFGAPLAALLATSGANVDAHAQPHRLRRMCVQKSHDQ